MYLNETDALRARVRILEGQVQRLMIVIIDMENAMASLRGRDPALAELLRAEAEGMAADAMELTTSRASANWEV
jgi:hypothetical protein